MTLERAIRLHCGSVAATLLWLVVAVPTVSAQQARVEAREKEQAEKAKRLAPYTKNNAERAAEVAERFLAGKPQGLYPWFGSVLGGGWLAMGPGYRVPLGDTGFADVVGAVSLKGYSMVRSSLKLPELARRTVAAQVDAGWINADKVNFFGVGNDSRQDNESSHAYRPTRVAARGAFVPRPWLAAGGVLEFEHTDTGPGHEGRSIEEIFTPAEAPGLGLNPTYTIGRVFAAIDWRDSPGYSRRGGLYRVEWSTYAQHGSRAYSFDRVEAEVVQLLPILREHWVIALRALASMSGVAEGSEVPYFLMPYLGSSRTLRGFSNRRFRDRNLLLMSAEYRWTPSHFLDAALFIDAGKVGPRRQDLNLDGLHTSFGIGVRFHSSNLTVLRSDLAWSREGFHWIVTRGMSF